MDCPLPEDRRRYLPTVPWDTPRWDEAKKRYVPVFDVGGYVGYQLAQERVEYECGYPTNP